MQQPSSHTFFDQIPTSPPPKPSLLHRDRARQETVQLAMRPNTAPTTPSAFGARPEKVDKAQLRSLVKYSSWMLMDVDGYNCCVNTVRWS